MAKELSRDKLNMEFRDGERPSGDDFASAWASFLHKSDDGVRINSKGNLEVSNGITIKGASDDSVEGTLRFHSGKLQYHNGTSFENISTGADGAFHKIGGGPNVAFNDGNVGIGTSTNDPAHRLEVSIGRNNSLAQRVKLGNLVIHNGSDGADTYISHANKVGDNEFALKQDSFGNTTLNAAKEKQFNIEQNGESRFKIYDTGAIELTPTTSITLHGTTAIGTRFKKQNLTVSGDLDVKGKINGTVIPSSDSRIKKDIQPFKDGIEKLLALDPVTFKFNGKGETSDDGEKHIGLIAQEVQKVLPELIHPQLRKLNPSDTQETEILAVDYSSLTFVLINAIKELSGRIEKLEKKLNEK